jgi:hypothetical protein
MNRTIKPYMEHTMKTKTILALLLFAPIIASAQVQTFFSTARFATNVFLHDNTNTPVHLRIPTNAVIDAITSTNGSVTVTTNGSAINLQTTVNPSGWSGFAATSTINTASNNINIGSGNINDGVSLAVSFSGSEGVFSGSWQFDLPPAIPGYLMTNGNAANLTNFPASLLTVSSGNTNYYRITTPPANNAAAGEFGQIAYNSTNIFLYHAASGKWLRVTGTMEW